MMMINALICVICQPFILRWAERTSLKISAVIGSIMFVIAFFLMGIYPTSVVMIISVIIMSLAELLTLPINGLLILRMAPKHLLASYNGLANMGLLGLFNRSSDGWIWITFYGGLLYFFDKCDITHNSCLLVFKMFLNI